MYQRTRLTSKQSKPFAFKQRTRNIIIATLILLSLILIIFSLDPLSNIGFLSIKTIDVAGADKDIIETMKTTAYSMIQGKYLGIFSRANTIFYPHDIIVSSLLAASPKIQSLEVKRNGLQGLIISVNEKTPAALICTNLPNFDGNNIKFDESDSCYFANDSGYLYSEAPTFSGHAYNRYYVSDLTNATSTDSVLGSSIFSSGLFRDLQEFYRSVGRIGFEVEAILAKDDGEYEMYILNPQDTNSHKKISIIDNASTTSSISNIAVIYFNNTRPFSLQLSNLNSFWTDTAKKSKTGGSFPSYDYIDVRYGSNIFYRLSK